LCAAFWRSREHWKANARQLREEVKQLKEERKQFQHQLRLLSTQLARLKQPDERWEAAPSAARWPPLPGHQFSPEMISLCCQLCLLIGFRAVPKVLRCVSQAFGLPLKIPTRDAVRNWNCRNGVAILQEAAAADDWIWMIDHSVQLGKMYVLVVLGIRRPDVPAGRALGRDDMTPLAVLPTTSRTKEEVGRQLQELAARIGLPLCVLCDGASELHEGVKSLETLGFQGECLDDVKHKIAGVLKRTLGRNPQFLAFEAQLGPTTAALQQTELDHLLPPRKKQKCRFMNLDRLIDWATMVQRQLAAPSAPARLRDKLGWVNDFAPDLQQWRVLRAMIGRTLHQTNTEGLFLGATEQLRQSLAPLLAETVCHHPDLVTTIHQELIALSENNERRLARLGDPTLRAPCSTEVLESAFGAFKALQAHHSRGTFTSLLATFATLFDTCTPQKIAARFPAVSNRDLTTWLQNAHLTNSTQSRRIKAYQPIAA
jgi:hypothetical protein